MKSDLWLEKVIWFPLCGGWEEGVTASQKTRRQLRVLCWGGENLGEGDFEKYSGTGYPWWWDMKVREGKRKDSGVMPGCLDGDIIADATTRGGGRTKKGSAWSCTWMLTLSGICVHMDTGMPTCTCLEVLEIIASVLWLHSGWGSMFCGVSAFSQVLYQAQHVCLHTYAIQALLPHEVCYTGKEPDSERWSNLIKVTELVNNRNNFFYQLGQNSYLWHWGVFYAFLNWSTQFHHGLFGWVLEPVCLGLNCSQFLTRQVIHHPVPQFLHPENGDNNSTHLTGLWWEFIVLVHVKCLPNEGQVSVMIVMMTTIVMALTLTSCLCLFAYPVLLHSPSTCHFTAMFLNSSQ